MTLEEFALKLREQLNNNRTSATIENIATRINKATINKKPLSMKQKQEIIDILRNGKKINGKRMLQDSDNSAYLKAVAEIQNIINNKRGNT